ncbi:archease [Geobacter sp. DSM 9736]|uniref:archease n=1 Tax=Geobacter sp. DSM 9736 TaxID=1277350 RepID=UPI000B5051DE|nr:archease [Geobacter sp. DSM 9736]SNB47740.1 SHS2 domain-containing protein [Geobacter sp. DSM 9736]
MPYRYLEEIATADAAFEAWGSTPEEMFIAAADAMLNVMLDDLDTVRLEREVNFNLENSALDLLLFDFLNELVFQKDSRRLLLRAEKISFGSSLLSLRAVARGEEIDYGRHNLSADVKAVTMYRFKVEQTPEGWRAMVVLDI